MLNFQYIVISTDFKVSFMTCTIKVLGQILRKGQSISLKALLETISKVIIFISFQFLQLVNLLSKHTDSTQTSILQNQFQLVETHFFQTQQLILGILVVQFSCMYHRNMRGTHGESQIHASVLAVSESKSSHPRYNSSSDKGQTALFRALHFDYSIKR